MDGPALAELRRIIGKRLVEGEPQLERFATDASHLRCVPSAAVAPTDERQVSEIVRWARRHHVPLVARGGGTSLDGESVPVPGAVVLDLSGWNTIIEIDPTDRVARVGPGVVNHELQRAAAAHGLFFPPNPGSWTASTVGGNASTNASGPRSFRYGPTRAWVRSARVVLGTGEVVEIGSRSSKRSTGPDLLQLLVGSEGTLGVFTELTVGLAPRPPRRRVVAVGLPAAVTPGRIAGALTDGLLHGVSAVEYLDARCARALAVTSASRLPGDLPLVLVEVEASSSEEEVARLGWLLERVQSLGVPRDPTVVEDADSLWTLRGRSGEALDRDMGERIREDVGVPVGRIDELLDRISRIALEAGVAHCTYGHLGEGSLHPNVALRPGSPEGEAVRARILDAALACGGTISSEHGIGLVKAAAHAGASGPSTVAVLEGLKRACDPDGILNPGKWLPAPATEAAPGS